MMKKRKSKKADLVLAVSAALILSSTHVHSADNVKEVKKAGLKQGLTESKLVTLFNEGKYLDVVKLAEKLLPTLEEGTKLHDETLYCLGGSYYYLGQPLKATPVLATHIKLYGQGSKSPSKYAMPVQYWDGSNEIYLEKWKSAMIKLKIFTRDYPDAKTNPYFALAKYDRAQCHTNIGEDELSIPLLTEVCVYHENCPAIERVYALRGNNYHIVEEFEKAHADYKEALKLARAAKHKEIEAEVLNYLVLLFGDNLQAKGEKKKAYFKLAVQYYDEFWKEFSEGVYAAQVAVTAIPALRAEGRGAEALGNLKEVIEQLVKTDGAHGLDKAINSYTEEYLNEKGNTPEMLEEHYAKDFAIKKDMAAVHAFVKMSLLDAFKILARDARRAKDQVAVAKWEAGVERQLKNMEAIDVSKLNNFTLVTIGDNIRFTAETVKQFTGAIVFYQRVITNSETGKDVSYKNEAILGLATVLAEVKDVVKMKEVFDELIRLQGDPKVDKRTKEKGQMLIVTLACELENYKVAIAQGIEFKKIYPSSRYKVKVRQALADAYFNSDDIDMALREYESILISYTGVIKYSGPAILKVMEICVLKGQKDKALAAGSSYVKICKKSFSRAIQAGKMTASDVKIWGDVQQAVLKLK